MNITTNSLTPTADPQLPAESTAAIRAYLFKLIAPVGLGLSVVTFLLGYFIKDIAVSKAEAQTAIKFAEALAQANVALGTAKSATEAAEKIRDRLATASSIALSKSDELVSNVSASLLANKQFSAELVQSLGSGYARLDQAYYVTSGLSGLNLDVLYAKKEVGAPVGQAAATPSQTWKISSVK